MSDFTQYIADALTSHIAGEVDIADFVLRVEGNQIAYFDIDGSTVWLITVQEAKFVVAEPEAKP